MTIRMQNRLLSVLALCTVCGCNPNRLSPAFIGSATIANQLAPAIIPFQPSRDGATTIVDGSGNGFSAIGGLTLAFAAGTAGVGIAGPGTAAFGGPLIDSFATDDGSKRFQFQVSSTNYETRGGDTLINWGRFGSTPFLPQNTAITEGGITLNTPVLHFITGAATPAARLPASGTAAFTLLGGTLPTGEIEYPGGELSGTMAVQWGGSASTKVGIDLKVRTRETFLLTSSGGVTNPGASPISIVPGTSRFSGTIPTGVEDRFGFSNLQATVCAAMLCQADINGFFAGNNAERAGLAYVIGNPADIRNSFYGTAAFVQGTAAALNQHGMAFAGAVLAPGVPDQPYGVSMVAGPGSILLDLTPQIGGYTWDSFPAGLNIAATTATLADNGTDGTITWGRWQNGTMTGTIFTGTDHTVTLSASQGHHFAAGSLTPEGSLPGSGTATFNLVGATKPTFGDGASAPGTFTGSAAVQWGGATANTRVGVNFTVAMPGDATYTIVSAGGLANPAISDIRLIGTAQGGPSQFSGAAATTSSGRGCSGGGQCFTDVNGFFAGPNAERIGLSYKIQGGFIRGINAAPGNAIYGAAAFAR
jgi:hypothetical protein